MTFNQKLKTLYSSYFKLWGWYLLFGIVFIILTKFYPEIKNEAYEQTFLKDLLDDNPLQLFVLGVVFAPIIEEMMFRTLIRPSHNDIILLLCSWPIFYVNRFIPVDVHWLLKLGFIAIFLFTTFYILRQLIPEERTEKVRIILSDYKIPALIITSLIFGLVHINNYVETFVIDIALFMLIVPRIISGAMMGWVKLKNKHLGWSIALHALNNGVVIVLMIF